MLAFLILPILCLLIGLVLLSLGIRDAVANSTRGYREVTGYLIDYTLQEAGGYDSQRRTETADTYRLVYRYNVDGQEYTLVTSYSTSFVPSRGSETEILYNPENPAESVIGGPNQSENHLIFIGLFFMFCSLPFFLPFLPKRKQKKGGKQAARRAPSKWAAVDWVGIVIGLFLIGISYGALAMISNSYSPVGIVRYYAASFHFMLLVPLLMIAAGLLLLYRSLPFRHKQKQNAKQNERNKKDENENSDR